MLSGSEGSATMAVLARMALLNTLAELAPSVRRLTAVGSGSRGELLRLALLEEGPATRAGGWSS